MEVIMKKHVFNAGPCLLPQEVYEKAIDAFTENRQTVVKAMCLHIAHDCNLACRYCEYKGICRFDIGFDGCRYNMIK